MKNVKMFLLILLVFIGFVVGNVLAVSPAQEPKTLILADLPKLPDPGLKPGDFFYFLDEWGEMIEDFFIFRPEYRARLQTERALERFAEIKALLERDGVDSPHLTKVKKRTQDNMNKAATILEEQKTRGVVVSELAKELGNKFDARYTLLEGVFEATMKDLEIQEKNLREQIRETRRTGNFERVRELQTDLVNIRAQKERVGAQKDYIKKFFEIERNKIKAKMDIRERELKDLADKTKDLFEQKEEELERNLKQKEKNLWRQEKILEIQLEKATLIENIVLAEQIRAKLADLEVQEEVLDEEKRRVEEDLKQEKKRLERAMTMRERAAEQIKEAKEVFLDIKEEMLETIDVPPAVSKLIEGAESKLALAEQTFAEKNYGKSFGQAMAAEMLVGNAKRILDEEKATKKQEEMKKKDEKKEINEIRLKIEKVKGFFGAEELDKRKISCIKECSVEIKRAKDCVFNIIPENMGFEEVLRNIRIKTRLKRECLDEALLVRTCLKREGCYQLFVDKLREKRPEVYKIYKKLDLLLPGPIPIKRPNDDRFCAQVLTPAINPITGECRVFSDACTVPEGWRVVMEGCPPAQDGPRILPIR